MIQFNLQYAWNGVSRAVRRMFYDRTNGLLNVEYHNGSEASWSGVTWDHWKQLTCAISVGSTLNSMRRTSGWTGINNDNIAFVDEDQPEFVDYEGPNAAQTVVDKPATTVNPIDDPSFAVDNDEDPMISVTYVRTVTSEMPLSLLNEFIFNNAKNGPFEIQQVSVL